MKNILFLIISSITLIACEKSVDNAMVIRQYGDAYEDIGYSMAVTSSGFIIAGQTTLITREATPSGTRISGSEKKMIVLNTDFNGVQTGQPKILGGGFTASGSKVIVIPGDSMVVAGHVIDPETQQSDIYTVKLSPDGSVVSEKTYKAPGNQYSKDIIMTGTGYFVLGTTDVPDESQSSYSGNVAGKKDALILQLTMSLTKKGSDIEPKGFPGNDEPSAIKADNLGGFIIAGTTDRSEPSSEQAGTNIFLFRINSDGSHTQIRIIGGVADETATDIEVLSDGYLIAGTTGIEGTTQKGYLWKLTNDIFASPEFERSLEVSPSATFSIRAICRYKSGSFLLAGQHGTGLSSRMLVIGVDALGNLLPGAVKVTGGTGTQALNDVYADSAGNIYAVGRNTYENNSMITFLKFRF